MTEGETTVEKLRKIFNKLFFPHPAVVSIVVPAAAALLIYVFLFGLDEHPLAYAAYLFSAYALTLLCVKIPQLIRLLARMKEENKYVRRYTTDAHLRITLSLYSSLAMNTLYALLQLGSGLYYRSIWFYALSGYYALLALMRFFLLRDTRRSTLGQDQVSEFRRYRFCGIMLLLVNMALTVIITFIVWQNRGFAYSEILTIAMAAYTFAAMAAAIVNLVRYRRYESPVMLAAKAISLTAALVSLLSLETALFAAFDTASSPQFRQTMTAATGGVVSIVVLTMACYMIAHATIQIKNQRNRA